MLYSNKKKQEEFSNSKSFGTEDGIRDLLPEATMVRYVPVGDMPQLSDNPSKQELTEFLNKSLEIRWQRDTKSDDHETTKLHEKMHKINVLSQSVNREDGANDQSIASEETLLNTSTIKLRHAAKHMLIPEKYWGQFTIDWVQGDDGKIYLLSCMHSQDGKKVISNDDMQEAFPDTFTNDRLRAVHSACSAIFKNKFLSGKVTKQRTSATSTYAVKTTRLSQMPSTTAVAITQLAGPNDIHEEAGTRTTYSNKMEKILKVVTLPVHLALKHRNIPARIASTISSNQMINNVREVNEYTMQFHLDNTSEMLLRNNGHHVKNNSDTSRQDTGNSTKHRSYTDRPSKTSSRSSDPSNSEEVYHDESDNKSNKAPSHRSRSDDRNNKEASYHSRGNKEASYHSVDDEGSKEVYYHSESNGKDNRDTSYRGGSDDRGNKNSDSKKSITKNDSQSTISSTVQSETIEITDQHRSMDNEKSRQA